jgi:RHH-type proline utilization regulon transcriptional repressor/proline dehydrogenase/delta 1-pyrroline-5-carboxylate dehydrogenase
MAWMAAHFVTGETIDDALRRTEPDMRSGVRFSFDMLGEGARTAADADRYLREYEAAIDAVGEHAHTHGFARPSGVSVKLSALHPRYEWAQRARVLDELAPRLVSLCERAAKCDLPLTVDAEEGERLHLSVELAEAAMAAMQTGAWQGLGFAVQAYDKRARATIDAFAALAAAHGRRIHLRLVKGAYWDGEVKRAQERGLPDFNVYTRKENTDVSYYACARRLLEHHEWVDPYFATHNALTAAFVAEIAGDRAVEFQRLHGMGEELHQVLRDEGRLTSVYAPVGRHDVLLGYLVRRLLENGANSSFVHGLYNPDIPVTALTADPVQKRLARETVRHPAIRLLSELFLPERRNSAGVDLADPYVAEPLLAEAEIYRYIAPRAEPFDVDALFARAGAAFAAWNRTPAGHRATCLERMADRMEESRAALISLLVREGGKCLPDAVAEVREAIDFCRYYAARARAD